MVGSFGAGEVVTRPLTPGPSPTGGEGSMWVSSGVATRKVRRETQKARDLRGRQTPEEQMLWRALRNRFLTLKFRRQQPIGPYIADFVCYEAHLVIELDGSQHAEEAARAYDAVRTEFLEAGGFKVLRFWNNEVRFNLEGVLEVIQTHLP
ncbi:endonuclease domain-containing protein [Deinococcus sp. YIM 134068]|uniref:endonuclease domain-containing protein n=1 Tax=Deinococcus lichenicola TaxID=3118910 RepID=UPI003FA42CE9